MADNNTVGLNASTADGLASRLEQGAGQLLMKAIEAEIQAHLSSYADHSDLM